MLSWITDDRISDAIIKYNPWWYDPAIIHTMAKPYRRLIVEKALLMMTHPEQRHYSILSGSRYVGKTTCLYQMIEILLEKQIPSTNILYLSFENPILKYAEINNIYRIYTELNPDSKGDRYLFFDDILYRGHWDSWMAALYHEQEDVRLAATTSASPIATPSVNPNATPSASQRAKGFRDKINDQDEGNSSCKPWTILTVRPLSFYEYCRLNGIRLPEESTDGNGIVRLPKDEEGQSIVPYHHLSRIQNVFFRYLKRGGLPQFARMDKEDYEESQFGPDIMGQLIRHDILSYFNIRHPQLCEQLMLYLASKPSTVFVAQQAAKDLGNISVTTLEQYLSILECANLIFYSHPLPIDQKGACKGHPKIYIADPAIRNALLMHKPEHDELENEDELNLAVEMALFRQLSAYYEPRRIKPVYHADPLYDYERRDIRASLLTPMPSVESSVQFCDNSKDKQPAKIGYFRKLHEPGKTIDIVVHLSEGQYVYNVMFYKRLPFRWKDTITSMIKQSGTKFLGASIITRKMSDNQTVSDGTLVYYKKEPAMPILYLYGQDEYEWRKEELLEERLEHDVLTGFDGVE